MKKNSFLRLLQWDFVLFNRNNLVVLAFVVALLYLGLFFLLKPLGNLNDVLIILVFNDPVVTGFLFAGILLLFDKQQNTLQALQVLPMPLSRYLLSKAVALVILSILSALVMIIAAHGFAFNYLHFIAGVGLSAAVFIFIGFAAGGRAKNFNQFLLFAVGVMIPIAVPLLWLFDVGSMAVYAAFPSFPGLILLKASLESVPLEWILYSYAYLLIWIGLSWMLAHRTVRQNIQF